MRRYGLAVSLLLAALLPGGAKRGAELPLPRHQDDRAVLGRRPARRDRAAVRAAAFHRARPTIIDNCPALPTRQFSATKAAADCRKPDGSTRPFMDRPRRWRLRPRSTNRLPQLRCDEELSRRDCDVSRPRPSCAVQVAQRRLPESVKTVDDFIAYAKKKIPGKLNFAAPTGGLHRDILAGEIVQARGGHRFMASRYPTVKSQPGLHRSDWRTDGCAVR